MQIGGTTVVLDPRFSQHSIVKVTNVTHFFPTHTPSWSWREVRLHACIVLRHTLPASRPGGKRRLSSGTYITTWDRAGSTIHLKHSQLIYSSSFLSIPSAAHHTQPLNFSLDQIIMASQKMALLAVAAGLLCMSALINGAEASVSAGHQQQLEIDTSVHS